MTSNVGRSPWTAPDVLVRLTLCKQQPGQGAWRGPGGPPHTEKSCAGFTLIELIISITLVSAIVAGMLTALRGGLLTLERTQTRIQESRGALGLDQMIRGQLGGIVPAKADCALGQSGTDSGLNPESAQRAPLFRGSSSAMLLVTTYSVTEGARGYPRLVEYRVLPNNDGSVRLVMEEMLFPSPETAKGYCAIPNVVRPLTPAGRGMVIAARLAGVRITYRATDPYTRVGGLWTPEWVSPNLPYAIRIEMQPGGDITIPLHVTRDPMTTYADRKE